MLYIAAIYVCRENYPIHSKDNNFINTCILAVILASIYMFYFQPGHTWKDGNCRECTCIAGSTPGMYVSKCSDIKCPPKGLLYEYGPRADKSECCAPLIKKRCQVVINGTPQTFVVRPWRLICLFLSVLKDVNFHLILLEHFKFCSRLIPLT